MLTGSPLDPSDSLATARCRTGSRGRGSRPPHPATRALCAKGFHLLSRTRTGAHGGAGPAMNCWDAVGTPAARHTGPKRTRANAYALAPMSLKHPRHTPGYVELVRRRQWGGEPGCVPSGDEENVLPPPHDHQRGPLSERPVTDRDAVTHVWEPLRDEPSSNGCPCHQVGSSTVVAPRRSAHHMILLVPAGQRPSQRRADDPRGDHESPARDDARGGQRSGAAVRLPARRLWSSLGAQAVWGA